MDALRAAGGCISVAIIIYDRVKGVQRFRDDCKKLASFVRRVHVYIKAFEDDIQKNDSLWSEPLKDLHECLWDCKGVIEDCCKFGTLRAIICADDMVHRLNSTCQRLQMSLQVFPIVSANATSEQLVGIRDLQEDLRKVHFEAAAKAEVQAAQFKRMMEVARNDHSKTHTLLEQVVGLLHKPGERVSRDEVEKELQDLREEMDRLHSLKMQQEEQYIKQIIHLIESVQDPGDSLPAPPASSADVPPDLLCPISFTMFRDPVMLVESGHTYDRHNIQEWLDRGNRTDPCTGAHISNIQLVPNMVVRKLVNDYLAQHPEHMPQCTSETGNLSQAGTLLGSCDFSKDINAKEAVHHLASDSVHACRDGVLMVETLLKQGQMRDLEGEGLWTVVSNHLSSSSEHHVKLMMGLLRGCLEDRSSAVGLVGTPVVPALVSLAAGRDEKLKAWQEDAIGMINKLLGTTKNPGAEQSWGLVGAASKTSGEINRGKELANADVDPVRSIIGNAAQLDMARCLPVPAAPPVTVQYIQVPSPMLPVQSSHTLSEAVGKLSLGTSSQLPPAPRSQSCSYTPVTSSNNREHHLWQDMRRNLSEPGAVRPPGGSGAVSSLTGGEYGGRHVFSEAVGTRSTSCLLGNGTSGAAESLRHAETVDETAFSRASSTSSADVSGPLSRRTSAGLPSGQGLRMVSRECSGTVRGQSVAGSRQSWDGCSVRSGSVDDDGVSTTSSTEGKRKKKGLKGMLQTAKYMLAFDENKC